MQDGEGARINDGNSSITVPRKEASAIKIKVFRGRKNVFKEDILVSNSDAE
jgi:hypothetical protein